MLMCKSISENSNNKLTAIDVCPPEEAKVLYDYFLNELINVTSSEGNKEGQREASLQAKLSSLSNGPINPKVVFKTEVWNGQFSQYDDNGFPKIKFFSFFYFYF